MKRLVVFGALILAATVVSAWEFSSTDKKAYYVIVDHDLDRMVVSCGWPKITESTDGSYFVHVHDPAGDTFASGKRIVVSRDLTEEQKGYCEGAK